jgi:hypothetical protein
MNKQAVHMSNVATAQTPHQAIVAKRVHFLDEAPAGAKVLRSFQHPKPRVAVEEEVQFSDLPAQRESPDPVDHLTAILIPSAAVAEGKRLSEDWMAAADRDGATSMVAFAWNGQKIQWRPGRLLVQGSSDAFEGILKAVTEFAYYESELRGLEQTLDSHEAQALDDVARSQRIRFRDRRHWRRFEELTEYFCRMRLTYTSLEPHLVIASATLPRDARQVMARLLDEAEISDRLEEVSNRLEACEDLYEGANDRVADYRWYIGGHWMELGIILLLLVEVALLVLRH